MNQIKCRTDEKLENSKIREEVKFVPARLKLIEYHQAVYKCPIITGKRIKNTFLLKKEISFLGKGIWSYPITVQNVLLKRE